MDGHKFRSGLTEVTGDGTYITMNEISLKPLISVRPSRAASSQLKIDIFCIRMKLQQKFKSFKQRHNNVFNKGFKSPRRKNFNRHPLRPRDGDSTEKHETDEKRYGKRIDLIRQKLREVLAHSSKTTESTKVVTRTFVPKHLKTPTIEPTQTIEINLRSATSYFIDRDIFKPKNRKSMLRPAIKFKQASSEESPEENSEYEEYEDYANVEIVSAKLSPELIDVSSVIEIVPKITTSPIPSTKEVSGIPRKYSYTEENDHSQFVNIETELESGESQDTEVFLSSNDRIDVEDLQYKEVSICRRCQSELRFRCKNTHVFGR